MEESNDCALKLGAATGVDSGGAEGLPDDGFADVGSDKQRYSRAQTFEIKRVMGLYIKKIYILPYPFCRSSSSSRTIRPATKS